MQEHSKKIQELSNFLLDYATTLMAVGSHTSRIVKNVTRIAESFGFGVDMTIFQRNITMTVKHSEDLSALSWEAYDHHPGLHELQLRFNTIVNTPRMSRWMVLLLVACANAAFCRLFGGDPIAMGLVWIATLAGFFIRQELTKLQLNHMVIFIICSFIASLTAALGVFCNLGTTQDIALGTSVLFLIPGVPLINSILDILEGHVLVGLSRTINATILIICIALGLSMTLLILGKDIL